MFPFPCEKAELKMQGKDDTNAVEITGRKQKPNHQRLKRELPHKPNDQSSLLY